MATNLKTSLSYRGDPNLILGYREFLRNEMPGPRDGYLVQDIDLILYAYGKNYQTDKSGKFRMIECKFWGAWPNIAQLYMYALMDDLMRKGDPNRERYLGFYIVQYYEEDWQGNQFKVNGQPTDRETFLSWLKFEIELPPYIFSDRFLPK